MVVNHDHQEFGPRKTVVPSNNAEANQPLQTSTEDALHQIWSWNSKVPEQVQETVHDLISEIAQSTNSLAVCAWDGNFTYPQLDSLATHVAHYLISELNVTPKSCIPILFHKSKWTCVAMLAVIKAGCSVVALDPAQPDSRLLSILEQVEISVMISSDSNYERARSLLREDVTVLKIDDLWPPNPSDRSTTELPTVSPSDIVYISFTSWVPSKYLVQKNH